MLAPRPDSWGLLLFRGVLGILFGLTALLMPGVTLAALIGAMSSGIVMIPLALRLRQLSHEISHASA